MMAALAALAPVFTAVGTLASAAGTIAAGKAANENAKFQAAQYKIKSDEELAQGSRETAQKFDEKRRVQSRLQAVSAADGGTSTDPTVIALDSAITREGNLQAGMAMATAESRAAGLTGQADAALVSGQAALTGSYFGAIGTAFSGLGDIATPQQPYQPTTLTSSGTSLLQKYG